MTRLKDATFESNAITGTDAYTSSTGSPTVDATSLIKGTYCARHNWTASANVNGTVSSLNNSELWYSFYIRVAAYPASTARVIRASNGSTQYNFNMTTTGGLNLRMNTTSLQTAVATLSLNTTYRIGIHIKCSTAIGNADSAVDIYVATGDTAFGAASYSNSAVTMNTTAANFSSLIFGHDNGAAATGDIYFDNIRIDDTSMPAADGGATDTPKTVNVTVTETVTMTKIYSGLKTITQSVTSTLVFDKGLVSLMNISRTVTSTASVLKSVGKPILQSVTSTVTRYLGLPHNVLVSVTVIPTRIRQINKIISQSVTETLTALVGRAYFRSAEVSVNSSLLIIKDILKPLTVGVTTTVALSTISIGKVITRSVSTTIVIVRAINKDVSYVVSGTVSRLLNVGKLIEYTESVVVSAVATYILSIVAAIEVQTVVSIQRAIALTKSVTVTVTKFFSKLLANEFTNTPFNKNVATLTLGLKNSALNILGRHTRTIDLQDTDR